VCWEGVIGPLVRVSVLKQSCFRKHTREGVLAGYDDTLTGFF